MLIIVCSKCLFIICPNTICICRIFVTILRIDYCKITIRSLYSRTLSCHVMNSPRSIWEIRSFKIFSSFFLNSCCKTFISVAQYPLIIL